MSDQEYISLKEAAELSGYSADYIGQLIRRGKLPGKQVFSNVAWMTTEEAVIEYLRTNKRGLPAIDDNPFSLFIEKVISAEQLTLTYRALAWAAIVFFIMFILFLVSVIAVSLDHRIDREYQDKIERAQTGFSSL